MTNITPEMDELQSLILGNRKTSLSSAQIRDIIKEPTSPELIILIMGALEKKVVDKDLILVQAINSTRVEDDLILVGLALRYGADPNRYVDSNLGVIHILAYTYAKIADKADKSTLNILTTMLLVSGATYTALAFDPNKKGEYTKDNTQLFIQNIGGETVIDWIGNQGYTTILPELTSYTESQQWANAPKDQIIKKNPKFMAKVGLYLNRVDLIYESSETNEIVKMDPLQIIKGHSNLVFNEYLNKTVFQTGISSITNIGLLRSSVINYNVTSYRMILDKGVKPNYTFINDLMTRMGLIKRARFYVGYSQLDSILITNIKRGISIDTKQFAYIKSIDLGSARRLQEAYKTPYWEKVCQTKEGDIENDLRLLALSLNYTETKTNKAQVCNYIQDLAKRNPESLKAAARRRQEIRVSAASAGATDFIDNTNNMSNNTISNTVNIPLRICRNRNVLAEDPYDYNDAQLAYYNDSNGVPWCFTSDMFNQLLQTKKNPISQESLPEDFILELKNKNRMLDGLGMRNIETITFPQALDKLKQSDTINDIESNREIEKFMMTAQLNGANGQNFRNMTNTQLQNNLQKYGSFVNLLPLSQDHAFTTFTRVSNSIIKNNPKLSSLIFSSF